MPAFAAVVVVMADDEAVAHAKLHAQLVRDATFIGRPWPVGLASSDEDRKTDKYIQQREDTDTMPVLVEAA